MALARLAPLASVLLLASCLSAESAEKKQLSFLEKGLEQDRFEVDRSTPRVDESVPKEEHEAKLVRPPPPPPFEGTRAAEAEPEPAVLKIWGTGKGVQLSTADAPSTASPAASKAGGGAAPSGDPSARHDYDVAMALVNGRAYPQAAGAFGTFLTKWPSDPNAANALYWQAECYYAMGELESSRELLERLLERFPNSGKVSDALLRLGMSAKRLGDEAAAKAYFEKLRAEYPKSEAARRVPAE